MQPTNLEEALRPLARERIAKGQLPRSTFSRMWGGHGTGQVCSLCDKPIHPYHIEYEIEYPEATLRFHTACLSAWQRECSED